MVFVSYKYGLPKTIPQMSSGTTSSSTSSIKFVVIKFKYTFSYHFHFGIVTYPTERIRIKRRNGFQI